MNKISAVYKIVNTVTGDFYVGSSKNVMLRWACHKCPSTWKVQPNNPLYLDMQKLGIYKFRFQILAPVMPKYLKQVEQEFIEMLQPPYNKINSNGLDVERHKETRKKYSKKYRQSEIGREANRKQARKDMKKYRQTNKGKETQRKAVNKYYNQLCSYKGETLTLNTLSARFRKAGIEHPNIEAKKYLLNQQ